MDGWGAHSAFLPNACTIPRARRTGIFHRVGAFRLLCSGPYAILEAVPTQQAEEVERCLVESLAG
jgi:hypothetical protein